jgi:hypothetical protein
VFFHDKVTIRHVTFVDEHEYEWEDDEEDDWDVTSGDGLEDEEDWDDMDDLTDQDSQYNPDDYETE